MLPRRFAFLLLIVLFTGSSLHAMKAFSSAGKSRADLSVPLSKFQSFERLCGVVSFDELPLGGRSPEHMRKKEELTSHAVRRFRNISRCLRK